MTFYLYDSRGYVGDLANIRGLYELREFLCGTDPFFRPLFDEGYTCNIAKLTVVLSVTESDDDLVDETIVNLRDLLIAAGTLLSSMPVLRRMRRLRGERR